MDTDLDYDVFLSHSAEVKAVVRDVAERLRKDGALENSQLSNFRRAGALAPTGALHVGACIRHRLGAFESGTFRLRDPLNEERRFLPLRYDDEKPQSQPA